MTKVRTAKLLSDGEEQIVVFPEDIHFPGEEVLITKIEGGVRIEPLPAAPAGGVIEADDPTGH